VIHRSVVDKRSRVRVRGVVIPDLEEALVAHRKAKVTVLCQRLLVERVEERA